MQVTPFPTPTPSAKTPIYPQRPGSPVQAFEDLRSYFPARRIFPNTLDPMLFALHALRRAPAAHRNADARAGGPIKRFFGCVSHYVETLAELHLHHAHDTERNLGAARMYMVLGTVFMLAGEVPNAVQSYEHGATLLSVATRADTDSISNAQEQVATRLRKARAKLV